MYVFIQLGQTVLPNPGAQLRQHVAHQSLEIITLQLMQPILDLVKLHLLFALRYKIIKRSKYETAFNIYNHDSN